MGFIKSLLGRSNYSQDRDEDNREPLPRNSDGRLSANFSRRDFDYPKFGHTAVGETSFKPPFFSDFENPRRESRPSYTIITESRIAQQPQLLGIK